MGLICRIFGHKWHRFPDGKDGCSCSRCGERNWTGSHDRGPAQPITDADKSRLARIKHQSTCRWCGDSRYSPHRFELSGGCRIRCAECGYEAPWHDFANGVCTKCGEDESAYYRRLVLSGDVRLSDTEEAPCRDVRLSGSFQSMRYADHLRKAADLAEVVTRYKPWGSEKSKGDELILYLKERDALEACVRRLGELAGHGGDEAHEANSALYRIALSGPEALRGLAWRNISDPALRSDPALAGVSEAWKREVERSIENRKAEERFLERDSV